MKPPARRLLFVLLAGGLLIGAAWTAYRHRQSSWRSTGQAMGTEFSFFVHGRQGRRQAEQAMAAAQSQLQRIEAMMSTYRPDSDLSRLNAAQAGDPIQLDPELLALLRTARQYTQASQGAMDPTGRPLFELWKRAGKAGQEPSEEQRLQAHAQIGWDKFDLAGDTPVKSIDQAQIDLGAIAKGYAVDRALAAIRESGAAGGMVEVGGDLAVFGRPGETEAAWRIGVRNPFDPRGELAGVLRLTDGAVATSGNYERFTVINGRRFSHIVDPATGWPVDFAPSVTVVARDCTTADAWATALSVLGEKGLALMENVDGLEAMIVLGTPEDYRLVFTSGFEKMLDGPIKKLTK